MGRRTLYVTGFAPGISARELAYEFEDIGNLYRCDVIPPARSGRQHGYAFVEFEKARDAEYAYRDLHNLRIPSGDLLHIEWAKTPLRETRRQRRSLDRSSAQRRGRGSGRSEPSDRSLSRGSRSPEGYGGHDDERRGRSRSPRRPKRDFSESPVRSRDRSSRDDELRDREMSAISGNSIITANSTQSTQPSDEVESRFDQVSVDRSTHPESRFDTKPVAEYAQEPSAAEGSDLESHKDIHASVEPAEGTIETTES